MANELLNLSGRVLAALDVSSFGTSVAEYAAWAATRLGAALELVHVLERSNEASAAADLSGRLSVGAAESLLQDLADLDERRARVGMERGRMALESAQAAALAAGARDVNIRQRHGALVDALLELEPEVRLYVLGRRGEHANRAKGHLGANLERVVRAAHRPLLVVPDQFRRVRRVLIAFDGSATTLKGVEMVAQSPLFRRLEVQLTMVGPNTPTNRAGLDKAVARLEEVGMAHEARLVDGDADQVLIREVKDREIDVLVMGAYGHSRIRHLLVGSTTTNLLRAAPCAVLLLR